MRQIVNKKIYDTKTATLVCEEGNEYGNCDIRNEYEALYITKKGEFFLYTEEGALFSYYSEDGPLGFCYITPVSKDIAYDWLEKYNEVEVIEEYFSDRIQEA